MGINCWIVEDNSLYGNALMMNLIDMPMIQSCQLSQTAEDAIQRLQSDTQLELMLLDIELPGINGIEAIGKFMSIKPDLKIIILTQSDAQRDVLRAISLGADGYLLKSASLVEITSAIRDAIDGGSPLDKNVARFILDMLKKHIPPENVEGLLTEREIEILILLGEGLPKKQIAAQLAIGYTTVDTHVGNIYEKLGVKNAPAAINQGHKLGLFT